LGLLVLPVNPEDFTGNTLAALFLQSARRRFHLQDLAVLIDAPS